jgi:hypothetical protein
MKPAWAMTTSYMATDSRELAAHGRQPDKQDRAIQLLVHVQRNTFRHAASVYGRAKLPLLRIGVRDARPITKSVPE